MCKRSIKRIEEYISSHLDEEKLLDEWVLLLNDELPKSRRMSMREMAHLFKVFERKGAFEVEHINYPSRYSFYKSTYNRH